MKIKNIISHLLNKMGFILVSTWGVNDLLPTRRLQKIVKEYKIDCIVDVGANVGQYADFLRNKVGYNGLIISFEPDPDNLKLLKEGSKGDSRWLIQDFALGKENTTLELNVMENSTFNSFLSPDHSETNRFENENAVKSTLLVKVKRLDEILLRLKNEQNFERVFLKLDTQGFDLDVFEGASGVLGMIVGVQTEVSFIPIYKNIPSFEQSISVFRSKGFEVSALYAVNEEVFPHAIEYDCIYLSSTNNESS